MASREKATQEDEDDDYLPRDSQSVMCSLSKTEVGLPYYHNHDQAKVGGKNLIRYPPTIYTKDNSADINPVFIFEHKTSKRESNAKEIESQKGDAKDTESNLNHNEKIQEVPSDDDYCVSRRSTAFEADNNDDNCSVYFRIPGAFECNSSDDLEWDSSDDDYDVYTSTNQGTPLRTFFCDEDFSDSDDDDDDDSCNYYSARYANPMHSLLSQKKRGLFYSKIAS